jgi:plasmid stability protein
MTGVAQLVVRNIETDVKARLKRRADRNGRSMEAEVRDILRAAVASDAPRPVRLGTRIRDRFKGVGLDEDVAEIRGGKPRPAELGP